jgi:hypothetical protein
LGHVRGENSQTTAQQHADNAEYNRHFEEGESAF